MQEKSKKSPTKLIDHTGDINEVYRHTAVNTGVNREVVKRIIEDYLEDCYNKIKDLEVGEQIRIYRIGSLKRAK